MSEVEQCVEPETNKPKTGDSDVSKSELSKRQLKKLARREHWRLTKPLRKAKEKEKRRIKIEEAKKIGVRLGPSRRMLKDNRMANSACKLKVVFDLSLDTSMTQSEMSKTLKQLHRCYSMNRRATAPLQMYVSGYSDSTNCTISKLGFKNWDVFMKDEPYYDLFSKETITYLTSDSPNVIRTLDHDRVYVIGALVDHNRLKNICYERALEFKVGHARLPLDEYLEMKSRKVLTIDQVYLILLHVSAGKTWSETFMEIIPSRKGAVIKSETPDDNHQTDESTSLCNDISNIKEAVC